LAQIPIYAAYPPGNYALRAGDSRYSFQVTHSLPAPINPPSNIDKAIGPFRLIGYSASAMTLHPGDALHITLYWQVIAVPSVNYTVFTHVLGSFNPATNGPLWAGQDGYPAATPTSALWVGQVIADDHALQLPANTPVGDYSLEVGMYSLETGQRLSFSDGADHVEIDGIRVGG
jgi:hypothetical protein